MFARQAARSLTAVEARALALRAQGFGRRFDHPLEVLDHLGVIQLDSVNVLARTQWLIPFARMGSYSTAELNRAIYQERRGFEYWGHEASWLPIAEFRYFEPRKARMRERTRGWWGAVREQHAELFGAVLARIRSEGALGASAFEDPRSGRSTWWDWKPAKRVLEDLFDRGDLMCRERTAGFARLYDLPERVLPPDLDTTDPGPEAAALHLMRRGFRALGVATGAEAADYFRLKPDEWRPALETLVARGEVEAVSVEGWRGPAYVVAGALDGPTTVPEHRPTFLSPFDSLVWERQRTERLFGFRYRIEIYTPEPKRVFGYYVLPLLVQGELVGRADLKLDRPTGTLRIRRLFLEGGRIEDALTAAEELAGFLGAGRVELERAESRLDRR